MQIKDEQTRKMILHFKNAMYPMPSEKSMKSMPRLVSWSAKNFQNKQVLHTEYGKVVTNWNQETRINKLYLHFKNTIQRVLHKRRNIATSLDLEFPELISFTNAMYINQN